MAPIRMLPYACILRISSEILDGVHQTGLQEVLLVWYIFLSLCEHDELHFTNTNEMFPLMEAQLHEEGCRPSHAR